MSPSNGFLGSVSKVNHAKWHLDQLTEVVANYLANKPYQLSARENLSTNMWDIFVASLTETPEAITMISGDVLYNLRSALDHLAWGLVSVKGQPSQPNGIYFPIGKTAAAYLEKRKKLVGLATPAAVAQIDALMPYQAYPSTPTLGNDHLWHLHRLNIIDKHRAILTCGSAVNSVNLGAAMFKITHDGLKARDARGELNEVQKGFLTMKPLDAFFRFADQHFPLRQGDVLLSYNHPEVEFRFELHIAESDLQLGKPIVQSLKEMVDEVHRIVVLFAKHLT